MFMRRMMLTAATILMLPAAAELEWLTDIQAARRLAAEENKAVLIDFTGSDWCHWCIRLRKEVLDTPEFEAYAKERFVPVEIDIPNDRSADPDLYARNEALAVQYGIGGFPTVVVMNTEGIITGGFVGGRPGVSAVRTPLEAALKNADAWQKTRSLQGMERAHALMNIVRNLGRGIPAATLQQEVMELDTEDTYGLRRAHAVSAQMEDMQNRIRSVRRPQERLAVIEKVLPEALPENRAALLRMQANMQLLTATTEQDIAKVKGTTLAALEATPNLSAEERTERRRKTEDDFADPAAILAKAREAQAEYERRTRAVEEAEQNR